MPELAGLIDEFGNPRGCHRLRQTRLRPNRQGERLDLFFVVMSHDDDGKILAAGANCTEQSQSIRPGFEIDHRQIEIPAEAGDNLERVVRAVCEMTVTAVLQQHLRHRILQLGIVRQKKNNWSLRA